MTTCVHHDKYRHTRQFKGRDGFWKSKTTCDLCAAYRAGAEAMRARCAALVMSWAQNYPEDVFIEPPKGEHGKTVDACSAAALRRVLPTIANDIDALPLDAPKAEGVTK